MVLDDQSPELIDYLSYHENEKKIDELSYSNLNKKFHFKGSKLENFYIDNNSLNYNNVLDNRRQETEKLKYQCDILSGCLDGLEGNAVNCFSEKVITGISTVIDKYDDNLKKCIEPATKKIVKLLNDDGSGKGKGILELIQEVEKEISAIKGEGDNGVPAAIPNLHDLEKEIKEKNAEINNLKSLIIDAVNGGDNAQFALKEKLMQCEKELEKLEISEKQLSEVYDELMDNYISYIETIYPNIRGIIDLDKLDEIVDFGSAKEILSGVTISDVSDAIINGDNENVNEALAKAREYLDDIDKEELFYWAKDYIPDEILDKVEYALDAFEYYCDNPEEALRDAAKQIKVKKSKKEKLTRQYEHIAKLSKELAPVLRDGIQYYNLAKLAINIELEKIDDDIITPFKKNVLEPTREWIEGAYNYVTNIPSAIADEIDGIISDVAEITEHPHGYYVADNENGNIFGSGGINVNMEQ